jgi:hypothetical protein
MMHDQATTVDPILEGFKAEAKPPATTEELVAILTDVARYCDELGPRAAFDYLAQALKGKTDAWVDAVEAAWEAAEAAA